MVSFPRTNLDGGQRRLLFSYAPDWIIAVALMGIFYGLERIPGYKRLFSLEDKTIQFPFAEHERVPDWALFVICFVAPLCMQPILNYFTSRSKWDWYISTLGLLFSISLTAVVTEVTKITVGRPRPDLISRCVLRAGSVDPPLGLSSSAICTQTDSFIFHDGWRSFPSGHSSLSFAGLGFFSLYIAGKLHLFDRGGYTFKIWLSLTPLVAAALVAISRTMDYRHHWQDVLAGSILGFTLAYISYRQYYPALHSSECHKPYPPRFQTESSILPVYDEGHGSLEMHIPNENGYSPTPYHDDHSDEEHEQGLAGGASAQPLRQGSRDITSSRGNVA